MTLYFQNKYLQTILLRSTCKYMFLKSILCVLYGFCWSDTRLFYLAVHVWSVPAYSVQYFRHVANWMTLKALRNKLLHVTACDWCEISTVLPHGNIEDLVTLNLICLSRVTIIINTMHFISLKKLVFARANLTK